MPFNMSGWTSNDLTCFGVLWLYLRIMLDGARNISIARESFFPVSFQHYASAEE